MAAVPVVYRTWAAIHEGWLAVVEAILPRGEHDLGRLAVDDVPIELTDVNV